MLVLLGTFVFLFLIKAFNVSYPLTLTITNTTRTSELAVTGDGKVDAVPDTAYVDLGISVANVDTAQNAQTALDGVNNKIIEALKTLGIAQTDIKTSNYNVVPAYSYLPNEQNKISGYNGNATVTVKLHDPKLVGQAIAAATAAGANQVQSTRFVVDQPEKYREQARDLAIQNAKAQAQKLAKSLGISLGKITNVVEAAPNQPVPMQYAADRLMAPMAGGAGPVVEPGTETINSTVTLYFEKN